MSHGQYKFPRVIRTFLKTVQRYDIRCLEKKDIKGQIISKANTQAEDSFLLVCDLFSFDFWRILGQKKIVSRLSDL